MLITMETMFPAETFLLPGAQSRAHRQQRHRRMKNGFFLFVFVCFSGTFQQATERASTTTAEKHAKAPEPDSALRPALAHGGGGRKKKRPKKIKSNR